MTLYTMLLVPVLLLPGLEVPVDRGGVAEGLPGVPHDTIRVASSPLEAASVTFAAGFANPSGNRLGTVLAPTGIRLHIDDMGHSGLSSRQALAALREFLRGYESGAAVVTRAASVEGSPNRGFAELIWSARMAGTSQEVRRTLFLGFLRESGEWRVDEVRILR